MNEVLLSELKHQLLQTIINPDEVRHTVKHNNENTMDLGDAPPDKSLVLVEPLKLKGGSLLYGVIKKSGIEDLKKANYIKFKFDELEGIAHNVDLNITAVFGLIVPEGLVGAKEVFGNLDLEEVDLSTKVTLLEESTVEDEKNFTEESSTETEELFEYIDPDFAEFLGDLNPHAVKLVNIMESIGSPFEAENIESLDKLEMHGYAYIHNPEGTLSGYNSLDNGENYVGIKLLTGSVVYRITKEEAMALAYDEVKAVTDFVENYFYTPLAWYEKKVGDEYIKEEIQGRIFGITNLEDIYVADYNADYGSLLISGEVKPVTLLGIKEKDTEPVDPKEVTYGINDMQG